MKVMTPLLRTKNPSAPVGDKSGGDRRAARSLLSCAWWSGMGRLWRGMGGMGRPEPLSAHRPRRQHGLGGFHESRDTKRGFFSVGAQGPHNQNRRLDHCPRRQVTVFQFAIVHHCSPLFTKKLFCASVLAPPERPLTLPGRYFTGRVRAAWCGYRAACAGGEWGAS